LKELKEVSKMDWYDSIEQGVRDIVRALRNKGINTFCSCGHDNTSCLFSGSSVPVVKAYMTIECESYDPTSEADVIYNCLVGDFDVKEYKAILTFDYNKNGYYFKRWIIEIKKEGKQNGQ